MTTSILDALGSEDDFAPIFKFVNPGDRISGVIVEEPKALPLKQYGSTEVKLDGNGNPVMQILLILTTDQPADPAHDGRYRVYIDKPFQKQAVAKTLKANRVNTLEVGGDFTMTYVGPVETRTGSTAKDFTATYIPPAGPMGVGELGEYIDGDPFGDGPVA